MTPHDLIAAFEALVEAPDGVERLRELALQLAVLGRLVPQDPNDEPASALLERIKSEREELISQGRLRRQRSRAPVSEQEVPCGWLALSLGDVADLEYGKSLPASAREDQGDIPVYGSNGPVGRHHVALVAEPCLVVGRKGSAGAVNRVDGPCWPIDTTYFVCPRAGMPLKFLALMLAAARLGDLDRATAVPGLNREEAYAVPALLPPLAEQHRIVARVDELMALLDRLEAARSSRDTTRAAARDSTLTSLRRADTPEEVEVAWNRFAERIDDLVINPGDIAPLRQTVLALAVRGKLVAQHPSDEPAAVLLRQLKEFKADNPLEGRSGRAKAGPTGARTESSAIPSNWTRTTVGDVLHVIRGASPRPKGDPLYFSKERTPYHWVKISDIRKHAQDGKLMDTDEFLTEAGMRKSVLLPRDTLVLTNSATIGVPVVLGIEGCCIHDGYLAFPKFPAHLLMREFVVFVFQTLRGYAEEQARGLAQVNLNTDLVRAFPFGLPPFAEQKRIVARVGDLMALLERLEARLDVARTTHAAFAAAAVHHLGS